MIIGGIVAWAIFAVIIVNVESCLFQIIAYIIGIVIVTNINYMYWPWIVSFIIAFIESIVIIVVYLKIIDVEPWP